MKAELQRLKTEDRPQIIQAIATAREHGDLKENAEYHAAREQQSFCEGRIKELESNLSMAQIIDVAVVGAANPGKVVFGATVELEDVESGETITYQIVGDIEADIKHNRIAISSPIARAMIGKEEGDVAVVQAPGGVREYEIVAVSLPVVANNFTHIGLLQHGAVEAGDVFCGELETPLSKAGWKQLKQAFGRQVLIGMQSLPRLGCNALPLPNGLPKSTICRWCVMNACGKSISVNGKGVPRKKSWQPTLSS